MDIDLSYASARKVAVVNAKKIKIILVGCGGTGSWLAPSVARCALILTEKFNKEVQIVFVDPDYVEGKNVYRQNFSFAEVGRAKADTLALRFSSAWGIPLPIKPLVMDFDSAWTKLSHWSDFNNGDSLTVILGCVDNPTARQSIGNRFDHKAIQKEAPRRWWIDAGNGHSFGQVLLGSSGDDIGAYPLPEYAIKLPLPSIQHPELVSAVEIAESRQDYSNLSCADMAMLDAQSLTINQRMASEVTDFLFRLLVTRDLDRFATYVNLKSGSSRSLYITPDTVSKALENGKVVFSPLSR